jgi:hypothetical protein
MGLPSNTMHRTTLGTIRLPLQGNGNGGSVTGQ